MKISFAGGRCKSAGCLKISRGRPPQKNMSSSMSRRCRNRNFHMFKRIEVKGTLGFSFWCALALGCALVGWRTAVAQPVFMLLIDKSSKLLRDARAVSVAPDRSIYVADTGHHRILQLSPDGKLLGEIGGLGSDHGQFRWPVDVAAEQGTSIWVSDFGNRRIERFTRRFTWQGTIELPSIRADAAAQPGPIAVTALGDLFAVDQNAQSLLKFNPLGQLQAEFGDRKGTGWISGMKSLAAHSGFGVLWLDSEGDVVHHMDLFGNALNDIGRGQ
ncbi:MAG: hypothetical protein FJY66_05860, partial [Calditrichaeota bacterium]|nr:hypothetical protein [Calditrichota bacterium]